MIQKFFKATSLTVMALYLMTACTNNPYTGFTKTKEGVYITYHQRGEGDETPQLNDFVALDMIYRLKDTVIFNSLELYEPLEIPVIVPTFQGDLYAALQMMHIDDSVTVAFPADSFYLVTAGMQQLPDFIKAGEPMFFDIKLKAIKTAEQVRYEYREQLQKMKIQEQEVLQAYLEDQKITVKPTASGLYYIEEVRGTGPRPKEGDVLKVHIAISMIEGFPLISTFDQEPMDVVYGEPFDTEGFDEALGYMRSGSRAKLIVPSHLAFDSLGQGQIIPPYSTLLYDVELKRILSPAEAEKEREKAQQQAEKLAEEARLNEQEKIDQYIQQHNIQEQPTENGIYYIETEKGQGKQAENGKMVKVHYTLYNIEGKQLQSSKDMGQAFTFTLGQGQVIKGWDEALLLMKEGGKAKIILPSSQAYGANDRNPDIPPYSPLVFEVELIEVNN